MIKVQSAKIVRSEQNNRETYISMRFKFLNNCPTLTWLIAEDNRRQAESPHENFNLIHRLIIVPMHHENTIRSLRSQNFDFSFTFNII